MPKDFFQDITPPAAKPAPKVAANTSSASMTAKTKPGLPRSMPPTSSAPLAEAPPVNVAVGDRSIRNIASPRSRVRQMPPGGPPTAPPSPNMWNTGGMADAVKKHSRWWLWVVALGALAVLGLVLVFAFRPTVVTVTPRTHTVIFDASNRYTAYPAATAEANALAYTLKTLEFEDSMPVPAGGTERVEEKAHGTITILNEHSASPVRLIKNTRFQTPEGLVFRVPDSVTVPGKKGTTPGMISVEVYADAPGTEYNVGPVSRFTLPGLKSSPDMYAAVYARSEAPFTGGFIGERPQVAPRALESARAEVRGRLEAKAAGARGEDAHGLALPGLYRISYVSQPHTTEAGGGVRIHEKAIVTYPIFTTGSFSSVVASGLAADAENASVRFTPGSGFSAVADASGLSALESGPFSFSLSGEGKIVFDVDTETLQNALAGREKSAFEAIAASFPGIETARARVSPFWSGTFPSNPADIAIVVESGSK